MKYLNSKGISSEGNNIVEKYNHCLLWTFEGVYMRSSTKLLRESILKSLRPMYKY